MAQHGGLLHVCFSLNILKGLINKLVIYIQLIFPIYANKLSLMLSTDPFITTVNNKATPGCHYHWHFTRQTCANSWHPPPPPLHHHHHQDDTTHTWTWHKHKNKYINSCETRAKIVVQYTRKKTVDFLRAFLLRDELLFNLWQLTLVPSKWSPPAWEEGAEAPQATHSSCMIHDKVEPRCHGGKRSPQRDPQSSTAGLWTYVHCGSQLSRPDTRGTFSLTCKMSLPKSASEALLLTESATNISVEYVCTRVCQTHGWQHQPWHLRTLSTSTVVILNL